MEIADIQSTHHICCEIVVTYSIVSSVGQIYAETIVQANDIALRLAAIAILMLANDHFV